MKLVITDEAKKQIKQAELQAKSKEKLNEQDITSIVKQIIKGVEENLMEFIGMHDEIEHIKQVVNDVKKGIKFRRGDGFPGYMEEKEIQVSIRTTTEMIMKIIFNQELTPSTSRFNAKQARWIVESIKSIREDIEYGFKDCAIKEEIIRNLNCIERLETVNMLFN